MNSIYLLIVIVVLLIAGSWLIPRVYSRSSTRIVKRIPELAKFPPEERGKIWLESICESLMQWQSILGFVLLLTVGGGLIIALEDLAPDRWVKGSVLIAIMLAVRPIVIRRARAVLLSKSKVSKSDKHG
jgi:hypothetical protein